MCGSMLSGGLVADDHFSAFAWHRAVLSDRCTLDPSEGLVMLALVRYADERGCAFPGFAALGGSTRIGRTKVIESLAELEARGLFVRQSQTRGKGLGSNHYELPLEPPMKGLEGERRVVRHPHQSATRTSPPAVLGSPPAVLALVRQPNGGSSPGEPYLLTDLPNVTTQGSTQPRERGQRSPTKGTRKVREVKIPRPVDWAPTEAHKAFAMKHRLDLELEVKSFDGWAEGRMAVSWNGTFTTRLANQAKWNRERVSGARQGFVRQTGGTVTEGNRNWIDEDTAAEAAGSA